MKKTVLAGLLVLASVITHAQGVDWETNPKLHSISASEAKAPAIVMKDDRILEYYISSGNFRMYKTMHKIIRVLNDKAMEEYNKVYVPMSSSSKLVQLKARSIAPNGGVVEVNQSNIKELKDVGDYGNFKIFAIEGLQKGGEVEYIYTIDTNPLESGREVYQSDVAIKSGLFKIISPKNMEFEAKGYNNFPEIREESGLRRTISATLSNIPGLKKERYTTYDANLMRVDFRMASITHANGNQIEGADWSKISSHFRELMYDDNSKDNASVHKLLNKVLSLKGLNEEQKIKVIEEYVKTNIALRDYDGPEYSTVRNILTNKYGNEFGITRLYALCFKQEGITNNLLITSNRYKSRFDESFPTWNNLRHFVFIFPQLSKYLVPKAVVYRLGMAPSSFASNQALVLSGAFMHTIATSDTSVNYIHKDIDIQIPATLDHALLDVKFHWNGHRGMQMRGYYHYSDEKERDVLIKESLDTEDDGAQIVDKKVSNDHMSNSAESNPFILEAKINSAAMIESAGNNIIFNVGKAIGKQTELYQENERQQNIDMDQAIKYVYNIHFTIPEGYLLKGAEDLALDHFLTEKGAKVAQFKSSYQVKGKEVKVLVEEFYTKAEYNKEDYEAFRKVINASADFSKTVLVFEKDKVK